jgi:hypothetical protein
VGSGAFGATGCVSCSCSMIDFIVLLVILVPAVHVTTPAGKGSCCLLFAECRKDNK